MATIPSELLDEEVKDEHIEEIARDYLTDWEKLRPYLGLSRAREKGIRRSFPGDYGQQKREFLDVWKEEKGHEATFRAFIQAAEEMKHRLLADKVMAMLQKLQISRASSSGAAVLTTGQETTVPPTTQANTGQETAEPVEPPITSTNGADLTEPEVMPITPANNTVADLTESEETPVTPANNTGQETAEPPITPANAADLTEDTEVTPFTPPSNTGQEIAEPPITPANVADLSEESVVTPVTPPANTGQETTEPPITSANVADLTEGSVVTPFTPPTNTAADLTEDAEATPFTPPSNTAAGLITGQETVEPPITPANNAAVEETGVTPTTPADAAADLTRGRGTAEPLITPANTGSYFHGMDARYQGYPLPMAAYPPVLQPSSPTSRVELRISCKDLRCSDLLSKSDPMAVVYTYNQRCVWTEYARTEQIKNCQSPQFMKSIEITYQFEVVQRLRFVVYDIDNDTASLADDDYLGGMECTLGEIVSAHSFTKPLQSKSKKDGNGTITITAEEVSSDNQMLELRFSAQGLDKKDFMGKSDPYLEFARHNPDGSYSPVHKIPHIRNTLNPHWPPFKVESNKLCGGDTSRSIRVQCLDWDKTSAPDLIGEFYTNLAEMSQAAEEKKLQWEAINPVKKKKKKSYKNSGTITLDIFKSTRIYSFLDYIMGGCQLNFTVGVDFTGSNGNPSHPQSLHYIDPSRPNEYTHALWAVGGVCQDYDTDKLFPAFGFGAMIGGKVSHEFPLNGNWENPYCAGIQGVVQAYHQSLQTVHLYGPTNVAPIINHVARFAEKAAISEQPGSSTTQNYFVLLLLTDGVLSDMMETKQALINASCFPMSVIIVGVGGADFSAMDELDSDDKLLKVGGATAERDICQFVPFRECVAQGSPAAIASAVLAEIPSQVTEYFTKKNIQPLHAVQR